MENNKDIKGWGIDADEKNNPTYPIKKRIEKEDQVGSSPDQQPFFTEILKSKERPSISAVFGTTVPPSGLSGKLRRFAFKYGEGDYLHWLPLLLADRVNEVEGVVEDIRKGKFPNFWSETGMKASWKYDRNGVIKKAVLLSLVSIAVLTAISRKK